MAKRKDIEATGGEPDASPNGAPEQAPATNEIATESKSELPNVESPPLSPGAPAPAIELEPIAPIASAEIAPAPRRRFAFKARHKRNALLAASVAIAAALGAVVGAVASGGFAAPLPRNDVAGLAERNTMQQSIARLVTEVTALKSNVEAANKSAHAQIAKLNDKLNDKTATKISERFDRAAAADVTGSISPPQTVVPATRPAAIPPSARPAVVHDWTIRDSRDGYVYVQGRGGIYQVVPGAPLPGLGPVQSIRRIDGRWVVTTPKGIIVSSRDRRFFE